MKKKELLNEIMGVPKAIDFWVDIFSIIITGVIKSVVDNDEIEVSDVNYEDDDGNEVEDTAYRGRTMMDGKEVMNWVMKIAGYSDIKNLLQDPKFKLLPIYNPTIQTTVYFLPQKVYEIQFNQGDNDFVNASHSFDASKKSLSKIGKNEILVNQNFGFEIYLTVKDMEKFDSGKIRKMLKSAIGHELTHCYEMYNRLKTSGDPYQGRESMLNVATRMMDDFKYPSWGDFLHLVYLHLGFEINARVAQIYYDLKDSDIKTTEDFVSYLKKTSAYREAEMLENFDAKEFIDNFQIRGLDFFEMLEDTAKQNAREKNKLPGIYLKRTPEEGMTHLIEGWNIFLQEMSEYLNKKGLYKGKLMELVPQSAMKDPYVFFKFFEKRFHKKAERFKRKMYRVASLLKDKSFSESD
jgi:hypothetical protein